jgi:hypothetical protein
MSKEITKTANPNQIPKTAMANQKSKSNCQNGNKNENEIGKSNCIWQINCQYGKWIWQIQFPIV